MALQRTGPVIATIDLPNGSSLHVRESGDLLYLDAVSVNNGGAVPLLVDAEAESTLRALLEARRERSAQLGSPAMVRP